MPRLLKIVAILYSLVFGCAALWAWGSYLINFGSPKEHLLPGIVLYLIDMPSALIIENLVVWFPVLLNSSVLFLFAMTLCGIFQVIVLWCTAYFFLKVWENRNRVETTKNK
jgi:uncharacterized membrane protein